MIWVDSLHSVYLCFEYFNLLTINVCLVVILYFGEILCHVNVKKSAKLTYQEIHVVLTYLESVVLQPYGTCANCITYFASQK